ncbi:MAG TPA: cupin domain-containing protein [Thermoanaerobaculia bacterium]|nr:cupin domain-containing protein [Thermoanaerobaculia bacterium]
MRPTKSLGMAIAASLLLVLALARGTPAQDPAVVNAKTIWVKLENSRVRVLEAVLKPGDKENLHSHPAYVIYVIDGGKVRTHGVDGATNETELKAGDTIYRDPVTHWAENIGTTTIRLVLVELKST